MDQAEWGWFSKEKEKKTEYKLPERFRRIIDFLSFFFQSDVLERY